MRSSVLIVLAIAALQVASGFEFATVGRRKVLLYSLTAGSGVDPLPAYRNSRSRQTMPTEKKIPALFRSVMLNTFKRVLNADSADTIVAEMRKGSQVVASASFNVSNTRGLTNENWFSMDRLTSSLPFQLNKSSNHANLSGKARSFYICDSKTSCAEVGGLMGIGNSDTDDCPFVTNGGASPVLFYAKSQGPFASTVGYADQFLVYLMHSQAKR